MPVGSSVDKFRHSDTMFNVSIRGLQAFSSYTAIVRPATVNHTGQEANTSFQTTQGSEYLTVYMV